MNEHQILFRARRGPEPVTVALATEADLAPLAGTVGCARDMLEFWRLITVRSASSVTMYAVGWRILYASLWTTSAVVTVDRALGTIRKMSGSRYSLGVPGRTVLEPELHDALAARLRACGFTRVRRVPASAPARGRRGKRTVKGRKA